MLWKRLRRHRSVATLAILFLALGLGANIAIFTLVEAILLRALPYRDSGQLYSIRETIPKISHLYPSLPVNDLSFENWMQQSHAFRGLAMAHPWTLDLTGRGRPRQITDMDFSASMFGVLGVQPRMGRPFTPAEDAPGKNHVVILSDAFWRAAYQADPNVLGRSLDLNGQICQIIGVMPPDFYFPRGAQLGALVSSAAESGPIEIYRPLGVNPVGQEAVGNFDYFVVGRLRSGWTPARAQAELNQITANMLSAAHATTTVKTQLTPLLDQVTGGVQRNLWLMLGAVAAVLLLVCFNLANLFLVRAAERSHEAAVRQALGARRARLLRDMLGEGLLLALAGWGLGCIVAAGGVDWLRRAAPLDLPRLQQVHLGWAGIGAGLCLALACGAVIGLIPAWQWAHTDPQQALRAGARGVMAGRRRSWLPAMEAAITAVLLICAGLLLHSFTRLLSVPTGVGGRPKLIVGTEFGGSDAQRKALFDAIPAAIGHLPGVAAVGLTSEVPLQGVRTTGIIYRDGDTSPLTERPLAHFQYVGPGIFRALGAHLVAGREFSFGDEPGRPSPATRHVAIINAAAAARVWPGENPVGHTFRASGPNGPLLTIVGVSAAIRSDLAKPAGLMVYQPYWDNLGRRMTYVVIALSPQVKNAESLMPAVRRVIWSLQPEATIPTVTTMAGVRAAATATQRFELLLVAVFALAALLLAGLGIYAVVAYSVALRTAEIGVRMALGAGQLRVARGVVAQALTPVLWGLGIGVMAALAMARWMAAQLFQVHPNDPLAFAGAAAVLLAAALLAGALPAWRATRISPAAALRSE